jgi:hypothetical protein
MKPLPPRKAFVRHLLRNVVIAGGIIGLCLAIGVIGYHVAVGLAWLDALLNASMILAGMGPVDPIATAGGKLFASAYALFSGVAFITCVGVLVAPGLHHFLHRFHLEIAGDEDDKDDAGRDAPGRERSR